MKTTRAGAYGLLGCIDLCESNPHNKPIPSHDVAKRRNIPERFLLKVFKPLVDRRVLLSMKGPNGGYRLARPASKITVLEILEAVEGPIQTLPMQVEGKNNEIISARLQGVYGKADKHLRTVLASVTLAELAGGRGK